MNKTCRAPCLRSQSAAQSKRAQRVGDDDAAREEGFEREPAESFLELTGDPGVADHVREVYDGDIERVDLMVGLYAEPKPDGFGFSDTAFRIFLMMAGRRLQSDRFFTADSFNERVYTKEGIDWIDRRTMADVLRDNLGLAKQLAGVTRPFHLWAPPADVSWMG